MDRLQGLQDILTQDPTNKMARYGLAMEYSGRNEVEQALSEFEKLITQDADFANAYFMAAQTLAKVERLDDARSMLQRGIQSAQRTSNRHAESEMQAMLDELS